MIPAAADIHYRPHAVQAAFHADMRAWRWFCAGYGTGKTTVSVIEAFVNAVHRHPGYEGIVAAPTYPLLMQSWFTEWRHWIPQEWWRLSRDPIFGPRILIQTPAGESTIWLRSTSNPWSNEGINAAWMVFDEVTREKNRAAFDVLAARVRRGYPGRQRPILLTGPPMTRRHWTAAEFGAGPDDTRKGDMRVWGSRTHAVHRARTRDNPYLPANYERDIRARPGVTIAWCKQFLDAEFGSMEGQIYDCFSRDVHVVPAAQLAGRKWRKVVAGKDWGWTHPGALLALAFDAWGDAYLTDEAVHAQKIMADVPGGWIPLARQMVALHMIDEMYCDPSAPGSIEAMELGLRKTRGVRVYPANNDVGEGVRRVRARLEWALKHPDRTKPAPGARLFISDRCVHTIGEFESYARKRDRHGELTEAPEEKGDDAMDALRYAESSATT